MHHAEDARRAADFVCDDEQRFAGRAGDSRDERHTLRPEVARLRRVGVGGEVAGVGVVDQDGRSRVAQIKRHDAANALQTHKGVGPPEGPSDGDSLGLRTLVVAPVVEGVGAVLVVGSVEKLGVAVGGTYVVGNGLELSGGIRYALLGDATTQLGAEFEDNDSTSIGLRAGYRF